MAGSKIKEAALRARWRGKDIRINDGGTRGGGRLVAMVRKRGVEFYFAYFDANGVRRYLHIDAHDHEGKRGLTLQQARDKAADFSRLYRDGELDLRGHVERQRAEAERTRKEKEDERERAEKRPRSATLRELLDAYAGHLVRSGKDSGKKVCGLFRLHVYEAAPELAERRAADIGVDELVELIGRLVEDGKGRTAGKLRSFLRAAYALAIRAKTDPSAPPILRTFGIDTNVVASIGAMPQYNRVRDRVLSAEELGAFLRRLDAMEGMRRDAALLCILLGGQRPTQLLRARPVDVDLEAATIVLSDPKGRRRQPRRHVVPVGRLALPILARMMDACPEGAWSIFGMLRAEMLSRFVAEVVAQMIKAGEARERFEMRDLRRTAETMLAAIGVSSDVRAQLQSHGLGGVQARHYDRHSYSLEKRGAIERWEKHLERVAAGKVAKVTQINLSERAS